MNTDNLKYVVAAKENEPAVIRFFDTVSEYSTKQFNEEFLWLQEYVKPSKIVVLINSEGGSVLYGMSTFSIIQACPIQVDCIIEGVAASMGSVIWAAGDNLYMHDYSLLMIHNPFVGYQENEDVANMVSAFKTQLATIYCKRFGMTKDEVKKIMDGEGEATASWFDAKAAVKAGFIPKDHVIKTTKAIRDSVQNKITGVEDSASIREIMASIVDDIEENKLLQNVLAIHKQTNITEIQDQNVMDTKHFATVAAQLGFAADAEMTSVSARISELLKAEAELKDAQASLKNLEDIKIQLAGKEAEVNNMSSELAEVKSSLKKYQDAEQAALQAEIEATVQAAVDAGKIDESAKSQWITMAQNNFEMVKTTLASIAGREKITEQIAEDPANVQAAENAMQTAEQKMADKVKEVVGANFELKTF